MDYSGKDMFDAESRENFYVSTYSTKAGYVKSYENFGVYTILRSGHMVRMIAIPIVMNDNKLSHENFMKSFT